MVEGRLYRDSRAAGSGTIHYLEASGVRTLRGISAESRGKLLVFSRGKLIFPRGSRLVFILREPARLNGFDKGIISAEVDKDSCSISALPQFRIKIINSLQNRLDSLSPHSAALLEALLVGSRPGLNQGLNERFRRTGISHLLALSGLHLAVLAAGVITLLGRFVPLPAARRIVILLLPLYLYITGPQPSLIRAAVMFCLFTLGSGSLRRLPVPLILIYSYIGMLLYQPQLIQDQGFCFSFAALGGILFLSPSITRMFARIFPLLPFTAAAALGVSAAAYCATLPLTIQYYGATNPVGVIASLLLTPPIWLFLSAGIIFLLFPWGQVLTLVWKYLFFYLYELIDAVSAVFLVFPGLKLNDKLASNVFLLVSLVFFFLLLYSWYRKNK